MLTHWCVAYLLLGFLESSAFLLTDASSLIVLSGLIFALFLVLTLVFVTVFCFRRYSRRRQKYRSVCRDAPGDLPLKAFPEVGGPTQSYHTGCDLGLSASGSGVCLCRDLSAAALGDSVSVNSSCRTRSACRGCDVTNKTAADTEYHPRCSAEVRYSDCLFTSAVRVRKNFDSIRDTS